MLYSACSPRKRQQSVAHQENTTFFAGRKLSIRHRMLVIVPMVPPNFGAPGPILLILLQTRYFIHPESMPAFFEGGADKSVDNG